MVKAGDVITDKDGTVWRVVAVLSGGVALLKAM